MKISPHKLPGGESVAGIPANAPQAIAGAELLLSMVEAQWADRNGNTMELAPKAQQELEKIQQQLARLEALPNNDAEQPGTESEVQNQETLQQIQQLHERITVLRKELEEFRGAWYKTELARHPQRPYTLDYLERIFTGWSEIHGDRSFGDDPAIVCGMARYHDEDVMVIGHQKARDTKQKVYRNFGYAHPEGYRKALRVMKVAEKFGRPIFTFVDTPGAYPGLGAEERGQAEAIARNLREMPRLRVPIITVITGEGGSGGALAIAIADRVLMMENAVYSVISPEGCASIMWRDAAKKEIAAQALRITAPDLREMRIIDEIIPEPEGGAHLDHDGAAAMVDEVLLRHYTALKNQPAERLVNDRYDKFRHMAQFFTE
jgi:acetyl-CoA carboxylase carboxyl transferase subunit alpha